MTLIIGLACSDGVVMAADSAGTEPLLGVRQNVTKIVKPSEMNFLVGASGDAGFIQEVFEALEKIPRSPQNIEELREYLRNNLRKVVDRAYPQLERLYQERLASGQIFVPPCSLLLAGWWRSEAVLCTYELPGQLFDHSRERRNFYSIGSEAKTALAVAQLLKPPYQLTVEQGKVYAMLVMETVYALTPGGVAPPTQLHAFIAQKGHILVPEKDIDEIRKRASEWQNAVWQSFAEFFADLTQPPRAPSAEVP